MEIQKSDKSITGVLQLMNMKKASINWPDLGAMKD